MINHLHELIIKIDEDLIFLFVRIVPFRTFAAESWQSGRLRQS
jgi:hypothetical protein